KTPATFQLPEETPPTPRVRRQRLAPSGDSHRQLLADEYKFDGKRRNQSESREVMEKGKKGRHRVFLPFSFRDAQLARKPGNSSLRRFALPRVSEYRACGRHPQATTG